MFLRMVLFTSKDMSLRQIHNCLYRLKVLYRFKNIIDVDLRIKLCDSLNLSKLNYANTVFRGCLLIRTRGLIQRLQNPCFRYCFPITRRAACAPFLNNANLLKMEACRQFQFAVFGVIKIKQPSYLHDKLKFSSVHIKHSSRFLCS